MSAADLWIRGLAMSLGGGCGTLKLLHRHRHRFGYAVRHSWGRAFIGVSALVSGLIYVCFQLTSFRLGFGGTAALHSILLAVWAALISVGAVTVVPVSVRKRSGLHVFVTASAWFNEI